MIESLKLLQALSINDQVVIGDPRTPDDLTPTLTKGTWYGTGQVLVEDDFGEVTLWTRTGSDLNPYSYGIIVSDKEVYVEMRNLSGPPQYTLVNLSPGVLTFLPGSFGAGTSAFIDGSELVAGVDFFPVDRIRVQRNVNEAGGDARVSLYLFL